MSDEFKNAVTTHQAAFGVSLSDTVIGHLARFYELVQESNAILHLVAPMSAEEFAIRHVLESLTLLEFLPEHSRLIDVGAGAGLPSVPCLIAREGLKAVLIESKVRKASYLVKAVSALGIGDRVKIINLQFEEAKPDQFSIITCRALDKFTQKLPRLLRWSQRRTLLLFGGPAIRDALQGQKVQFLERLMPMSDQRYLFVVRR